MKSKRAPVGRILPKLSETNGPTAQELLKAYLSMPKQQRNEMFVDTARAAEITGLSRRTIQFWIETGAIRAVLTGNRYEIELHSLTVYLMDRDGKRNG